ncbi:hypothetical protein MA9V1_142 [Chryseobacterium phage MA9V-1]|nr:hypothetical protein MA9V1_142 [Chryseobacterium phage MA9V-1]
MFNNPNKTSWKVFLPPNLLPNTLNEDLSQYFFNEATLPYRNVLEGCFEAQITGYEIPELGVEAVTQMTYPGGQVSQLPAIFTHEAYGDNRVALTFKCMDGYFNYFLARYAFLIYTNPKTNSDKNKTGQIGDLIITFNTQGSLFQYTVVYRQVVWVSVDGKNFSYDATQMDFDTFGMTFRHNGFDIIPGINTRIAESKGLKIEVGDVDYTKKGLEELKLREK